MCKPIKAKTLLNRVKNDAYFGLSYNMNLYRGCQHGCIYCDSRSACYKIEDFSEILVKQNVADLLENELKRKRIKGTIGFGSMNDPYMPVEKSHKLTKQALEIIIKHRYPAHILTKSNLVLRDIDLLKKIRSVYAAVSFTITTADDSLAQIIEPRAPLPSERFKAIKTLSENGIYTGIMLMPVLPFINDTPESIKILITKAAEAGAKYIIPYFGVTLRDGSRDYFYNELDKSFKGIKEKYQKTFGASYACNSVNTKQLYALFNRVTQKWNIAHRMEFYKPNNPKQLELF